MLRVFSKLNLLIAPHCQRGQMLSATLVRLPVLPKAGAAFGDSGCYTLLLLWCICFFLLSTHYI